MKTFRLLTASLLIAVCAGLGSCGDDKLDDFQLEVMFPNGDSFSTYGLNLTKNVQFMLDMENIRILKYQALPPMELAPRTTSSLRVSVIMVSHTMKIISCSKQQQERSKK